MPPIPFLRALYCVDAIDRPLAGAPAAAARLPQRAASGARSWRPTRACSRRPDSRTTRTRSSSLRTSAMTDPNFVPLADLGRLDAALDAIFTAYGVPPAAALPDRVRLRDRPAQPLPRGLPGRQAAYLDQAEYLAWRDPRVRALSQFLLYDCPPDRRYPRGSVALLVDLPDRAASTGGWPKPSLSPTGCRSSSPIGPWEGPDDLGDAAPGARRRPAAGSDPVEVHRRWRLAHDRPRHHGRPHRRPARSRGPARGGVGPPGLDLTGGAGRVQPDGPGGRGARRGVRTTAPTGPAVVAAATRH